MGAAAPIIAAGAQLAGAGLKAQAQLEQGKAEQKAANFKADVAANNARLAKQQATEQERRFRIVARKQVETQRARIGAAGVTLGGSALDALEESAANAELDALTIRHGGEITAQGFTNEERILRFGGDVARRSARFSAVGTLLSGFAGASSGIPS